MNSKEKLAQALEEVQKQGIPGSLTWNRIGMMAKKAKEGYYSDYDSPLATPCIQLVKDLEALGLTELSARARDGEFDATEEESNAWYEREGKHLVAEMPKGMQKLFERPFKEEIEAKEGIKGWDI